MERETSFSWADLSCAAKTLCQRHAGYKNAATATTRAVPERIQGRRHWTFAVRDVRISIMNHLDQKLASSLERSWGDSLHEAPGRCLTCTNSTLLDVQSRTRALGKSGGRPAG